MESGSPRASVRLRAKLIDTRAHRAVPAGAHRAVAALLLVGLAGGCARPAPVDLFPYLHLARSVTASGQVFPGLQAGAPELPVGWAGGQDQVIQIVDGSADLELRVSEPGAHELRLEIQAPEAGMMVAATLAGRPAGTFPLAPGWQELDVPLAATDLRLGANRLRLDLTTVEGGPLRDRVPLRLIRLLEPSGRSAWHDRPPTELAGGEHELRMPSGSAVALVARVPAGSEVVSGARVERPAGSRRASLRVVVEALDAAGTVLASAWEQVNAEGRLELVLEAPERPSPLLSSNGPNEPGDPDGPSSVRLTLPDATGDELLLRWRVEGPGNGLVTWERLELVGPEPDFVPVPEESRALVPPPRTAPLGHRDVVVILLDAAREDAVSAYGGEVPTPAVDALADSRVEDVTAAAPWTAPSVASMMTGLYPDAHGLQAWDRGIPKSVRGLGESFAAAGYRTMFFTQHPVWGAIPTLRRGFEVQVQVPETERDHLPTAAELFGGPEDSGSGPDRPAFALVHLLLPHDPYDPPAPYRGSLTDDLPGQGEDSLPDVDSDTLHDLRRDGPRRVEAPSPAARRYARARYDETMLWTDALVGELVSRIDASGRDPLIVLLSDHGEAFYEHGWFLHTRTLYEEMVAVPLLFRWPSDVAAAEPVARAGPVSTVDLMPTLIDLLGLPYEGPGMHGRSLTPWLLGPSSPEALRSAYSVTNRVETSEDPEPLLAYRTGRYKAILDTLTGRLETYDLEVDPQETDDLSAGLPLLAQWLFQGLQAQRQANLEVLAAWRGAGQTTELSPETIERLRALGYLR